MCTQCIDALLPCLNHLQNVYWKSIILHDTNFCTTRTRNEMQSDYCETRNLCKFGDAKLFLLNIQLKTFRTNKKIVHVHFLISLITTIKCVSVNRLSIHMQRAMCHSSTNGPISLPVARTTQQHAGTRKCVCVEIVLQWDR
jgi:hypothetical protein